MRPPGTDPIRVYLIDDHPVVCSGLAMAIAEEPDIVLVGEAATAAEGLAGAIAARPDVVLVDLGLPDRDGPELIGALRADLPAARVVVLSAYDDEFRVSEALGAGAQGYLLKSSSVGELMVAIRAAAAGGTPLSPSLTDAVLRAMRRTGRAGSSTIEALTARERQVLEGFATGLSTRELAASLGISPKTVETHRVRIYEKLGARSVIDLTRIAVRTGLVRA
jgi:two-component system, NarL family, nitrate/nitrite response regulator NarL